MIFTLTEQNLVFGFSLFFLLLRISLFVVSLVELLKLLGSIIDYSLSVYGFGLFGSEKMLGKK